MISIRSDFQKHNFVAFSDLQANCFQFAIDFSTENDPPVFCWTHDMIDQDGYIMTFTNQLTHLEILSDGLPNGNRITSAASCGECTPLLIQASAWEPGFSHKVWGAWVVGGCCQVEPDVVAADIYRQRTSP